jgi:hypothetical protein
MPGFVHTNPEKKRKPLALSLKAATERMARAIEACKPCDAFPWNLRLPLALLRLAPAALADHLLRVGRDRSGKREQRASPLIESSANVIADAVEEHIPAERVRRHR